MECDGCVHSSTLGSLELPGTSFLCSLLQMDPRQQGEEGESASFAAAFLGSLTGGRSIPCTQLLMDPEKVAPKKVHVPTPATRAGPMVARKGSTSAAILGSLAAAPLVQEVMTGTPYLSPSSTLVLPAGLTPQVSTWVGSQSHSQPKEKFVMKGRVL